MKKKFPGRYLAEMVLTFMAIYFMQIAFRYPQETKEALVLMFLCVGVIFCLEICKRIKGRLHIIVDFCIVLGISILTVCEFCIGLGAKESMPKELNEIDYILVLGSKLESGELSNTLKARLNKAVDISEYINVPIIVSGGNSQENELTEAEAMSAYLKEKGVENNILLEEEALDTRQNFLYTAELAGRESNILVITSEVHLFRAKMLAREIGFESVYGTCANTDLELYLYYNLREVVSILREIVIHIVGRQ